MSADLGNAVAMPAPRRVTLLRELVRRSVWLGAGAAAGRLLPLAVLVVAGRNMPSREFANASAAYAWAAVTMSLASAGTATVMTQRLGSSSETADQAAIVADHLRRSLSWVVLLTVAVVMLGPQIGGRMFGSGFDAVIVAPAALSGALWSQVALGVAALNGCQRARAASLALAACGLLQGMGIAVALLGFGPTARAAAWGLFAGSAVACAAVAFLLRDTLPALRRRHTVSTAAPSAAATPWWRGPVLWNTVAAGAALPASFFAASLISGGADGVRQLAMYFALEQVHQALVYFPAVFGQALLPLVARQIGRTDSSTQRSQLLGRMARAGIAAALCGAFAGAAAIIDPSWLIVRLHNPSLMTGDDWAVRWMVMNASLSLALTIIGGAYVGAGWLVTAGLLNLAWTAAFLGLTWALAALGSEGLQFARFCASVGLCLVALAGLWPLAARKRRTLRGSS